MPLTPRALIPRELVRGDAGSVACVRTCSARSDSVEPVGYAPNVLIPRELVVGAVQMFSVKTSDGVVATSFKKDDKVPQSLNPNF